MKNVGVMVAVGLTALVVLAVGVFSFLPDGGAGASDPVQPVAVATGVVSDPAAIRAAFAAREALIQAQIQELDREIADRKTAYDARAAEMADLIATGDGRLAQLSASELALHRQIDELGAALAGRATLFNGQRSQANYQYQTSLQQLQAQLVEANAKLADARAQLGQ